MTITGSNNPGGAPSPAGLQFHWFISSAPPSSGAFVMFRGMIDRAPTTSRVRGVRFVPRPQTALCPYSQVPGNHRKTLSKYQLGAGIPVSAG